MSGGDRCCRSDGHESSLWYPQRDYSRSSKLRPHASDKDSSNIPFCSTVSRSKGTQMMIQTRKTCLHPMLSCFLMMRECVSFSLKRFPRTKLTDYISNSQEYV